MAIQVPIIEQEQSNAQFRPMQLSPINGPKPDFSGPSKLFDAVNEMVLKAKDKGDLTQVTEASRKADDWEATNLFDAQSGALAKKGKDTFGVPKFLVDKYDADMQAIEDGLANEEQKAAFRKEVVRRRDTVQKTLLNHERTQMEGYAESTTKAKAATSANRAALYYNNPEVVEASIEAAKDAIRTRAEVNGLGPEAIEADLAEVESKARLAVLTRMADNDPKGAIDFYSSNSPKFTADDLLAAQRLMTPTKRKYDATKIARDAMNSTVPKTTPTEIVDYVMHEIEGGDEVVVDNNGAVAKYGINQASNPDLDVENLSEDEARQVYIGEYYIGVGADELPADMRLIAFDAAVNHGVTKAKQMVEEADGDARKLIELRRKEYDRLNATGKKEYTSVYKGWINRLDKISKQVDVMRGGNYDEVEINKKIDASTGDVDTANAAKEIVSKQLATIKKAREESEKAASDEAWRYRNNGEEVPPAVEARMSPEEVAAMKNSSNVDPVFVAGIKSAVLAGQDVDLSKYRWQLGGKYDEIAALQADPSKRANARTVDDVIKANTAIVIGKKTASTATDFQRIEQFERRVDEEIAALQQQTGKIASSEDAQKIVDRLMLKVDVPGLNTRAYLQPIGQQLQVEDIPADFDYIIHGKPVAYDDLINSLISQVRKRGLPVNNANVLKMFKEKFEKQELARVARN